MNIKKHRVDIDGLRSIAILPVLFFHAGLTVFHGGFIGVDIFFVISGFLITNLLIEDISKTGRVSLINFYERRIRRIAPILIFTLFTTLIFALLVLKPADLIKFSKSANATLLFFSNIFFWRESGYFEIANETKPLLHTWSLSIEEQFYLFFPLLLGLLMRFQYRARLVSLILLFSLSVVFAEIFTSIKPVASFYLIPTRSFELLAGSISAMLIVNKSFNERIFNLSNIELNTLCTLAFLCITLPIFLFNESMHLPGFLSLIPCIGVSAICILGARKNLISDILSFRPLVFIGLISYSLYIWHQPVLAFARIISVNQLTTYNYLALLFVVFILSIFSWKFIEQPFRNKSAISKRKIYIYFFIFSTILLTLNTFVILSNGLPQRYTDSQLNLIKMGTDGRQDAEKCSGWSEKPFEINKACTLGDENSTGDASVLLFGDSHGAAIAPALSEKLKSLKLKGIQATYLGCLPAVKIERIDKSFKCIDFSDQVMSYLQTHPSISTVVIVARWTLLSKQSGFDNMEGGKEPAERPIYKNELHGEPLFDNSILTIKEILKMNKHVLLVYPIPEVGWNVPDRLIKLPVEKWSEVSTSHQVYLNRTLEVRDAFNSLTDAGLTRVYPDQVLCRKNARCITVHDNQPLYYDDDHLSIVGARLILSNLDANNFKN